MIRRFLIVIFLFLIKGVTIFAQSDLESKSQFSFIADPDQHFAFDNFINPEWKYRYIKYQENKIIPSFKFVNKDESDVVLIKTSRKNTDVRLLKLFVNDEIEMDVSNFAFNDSLLFVKLPPKSEGYKLMVYWKRKKVAQLNVDVHYRVYENITIVPLCQFNLNENQIQTELNRAFDKVNYNFNVSLAPVFVSKVFDGKTVFSNPNASHLQYTGQMRLLRDLYFKSNPKRNKKSIYIFIVNGFKDSLLPSFMVNNKSVGFIKNNQFVYHFSRELVRTLGYGLGGLEPVWLNNGPEKGTTLNVMDSTNITNFTFFQWEKIHKLVNYYSYYDNEENVKTNNGTVAYYFWEEDVNGNIVLSDNNPISSIRRPYKFNYLSYRFKVKYFLLRPFFKIGNYYVSILDGVLLTLAVFVLWFTRMKLKRFWLAKKLRFHFFRRFIFFLIICFVSFQVYENYWVTNRLLFYFKHIGGELEELHSLPYSVAKKELLTNQKLLHEEVPSVCSEILILKKGVWDIKKRGKVLYFDVSKENDLYSVRFSSSEDSIKLGTLGYQNIAHRHYIVFNFKDQENSIKKQIVYTHSGVEITSKFKNEDKPKRILLFVNGYRPTSIGQTFAENFSDIKVNGIEHPNSSNYIYDFDRFDYWTPWNQINLLFQKRINPSNTYYADGHFSVKTSNYESLLNFTSVSSLYPKRCVDSSNHTCYKIQDATWKQFLMNQSKTINQIKLRSNIKGYNYRKYKGRIAGKNLLQILNESPGLSKNDTLFIVAHSMGFAYSEGIVAELRGKINFGGYYILAPENAKAGKVKTDEWKQIWQYGSNFDQINPDAPCLQDGIAPQYKVPGLPDSNRVFIPEKLYKSKGYFDSHFIGDYTWIFNIPKAEKGAVVNR